MHVFETKRDLKLSLQDFQKRAFYMTNNFINIDEILSELWRKLYMEISNMILSHNQDNIMITLSTDSNVDGVILTEGQLCFRGNYGKIDIAEVFTDQEMYSVYNAVYSLFK